jgi:hypothetical protein
VSGKKAELIERLNAPGGENGATTKSVVPGHLHNSAGVLKQVVIPLEPKALSPVPTVVPLEPISRETLPLILTELNKGSLGHECRSRSIPSTIIKTSTKVISKKNTPQAVQAIKTFRPLVIRLPTRESAHAATIPAHATTEATTAAASILPRLVDEADTFLAPWFLTRIVAYFPPLPSDLSKREQTLAHRFQLHRYARYIEDGYMPNGQTATDDAYIQRVRIVENTRVGIIYVGQQTPGQGLVVRLLNGEVLRRLTEDDERSVLSEGNQAIAATGSAIDGLLKGLVETVDTTYPRHVHCSVSDAGGAECFVAARFIVSQALVHDGPPVAKRIRGGKWSKWEEPIIHGASSRVESVHLANVGRRGMRVGGIT